jgi:hypothetical protein
MSLGWVPEAAHGTRHTAGSCYAVMGVGQKGQRGAFVEHLPDHFADTMTWMNCERRRLTIGVAIALSRLACARTPMDEQQVGATGTTVLQRVFVPTGRMIVARADHTATLLPSGKVLVAGGYDGNHDVVAADLYDPATGTFTATGGMTVARSGHRATLLPNGKVLIAGGYQAVASAELYDPSTGKFTPTGSMEVSRFRPAATLLDNGKVLVTGGAVTGGGNGASLASAELYDPKTGTFSPAGSMSTARVSHTATLLPSGMVLLTGGVGDVVLSSAELYDSVAGTFTTTGSMNQARLFHTATLLPSGKVLVAGGEAGVQLFASAEVYDPTDRAFSILGSMTMGRCNHTATLLDNGTVLMVAGYSGNSPPQSLYLTSAELYDPSAGTFTATGRLTVPMEFHTATLLPGGRVLITGGVSDIGDLANAELYNE